MNARLVRLPSSESAPAPAREGAFGALRSLLGASFRLQQEGARAEKLAELRGQADGYMRALLDAGLASERELLEIVRQARHGEAGPAVRTVVFDESLDAAS